MDLIFGQEYFGQLRKAGLTGISGRTNEQAIRETVQLVKQAGYKIVKA